MTPRHYRNVYFKMNSTVKTYISGGNVTLHPMGVLSDVATTAVFTASYRNVYFKMNSTVKTYISGVTSLPLPMPICSSV